MNKLLIFCLAACASISFARAAAVKVNIAVVRNGQIAHGQTCTVSDESTTVVYQDGCTYIEADLIAVTAENIMLRCLVSTSSESNRMLVVRGVPRVMIPLVNGLGMMSLNCDGDNEHFLLVISACPC